MTLRQVLDIVWQRRLLVFVTLLLVVIVSLIYLQLMPKSYSASAQLRLNAPASSASDSSGTYAGISLDTDPESITSPLVLGPAGEVTGDTIGTLTGTVDYTVTEGVRTNRITITAVGETPEQAQARANAVAESYVNYLADQVQEGQKRLQTRLVAVTKEVAEAQRRVNKNEDDQLASSQLASAIADYSELTGQISQLKENPKPVVVLRQALPGSLTSASPLTVLAVGLASGLLAGVGVAIIREQFDDRLRSSDDIEVALDETVISEIALDRGRKKGDLSLPVTTRRHTAFNESLRALRTSLQVIAPAQHGVLMITSPEPGDGKSFITANLAVSIARAGRSVIVVEGDLRRPTMSEYFGATDDLKGFADAIEHDLSGTDLKALLRPTEHAGLQFLPPGVSDVSPADLLATSALGRVLAQLRQMADVVIVDTPPALALADAAIIAGNADGVLVLATFGKTRRETLRGTMRVLRANGATVYGVAANRSRRSMPRSYQPYFSQAPAWTGGREVAERFQDHEGSEDHVGDDAHEAPMADRKPEDERLIPDDRSALEEGAPSIGSPVSPDNSVTAAEDALEEAEAADELADAESRTGTGS